MEFSITYDIMLIMLSQDIEMLRDVKKKKKKKKCKFSYSEDGFCLGQQCGPRCNAALCGIPSGSPPFAIMPIWGFSVLTGLSHRKSRVIS